MEEENKVEEAKKLLAEEEKKKRQEFSDKVNKLCEEYGFVLDVVSQIIIKQK